ncbi:hypothetical protein ElyMa_001497500 [Elysia marginata]|uniref:Uncharacterized protein n=1 Tax=Elysia marginata TaxID=1093978 RepID=A0AAV4J3Y4_9GAST|nr:hypothetical protein ElyMa_001497500 [Elysia marginata]
MDKSESHVKMAAEMKQRLKVEELEENIDELEDVVEDVFPVLIICVIVCVALTLVFLLRMYIRYNVDCPSNNRMDGKTVLITGPSPPKSPSAAFCFFASERSVAGLSYEGFLWPSTNMLQPSTSSVCYKGML